MKKPNIFEQLRKPKSSRVDEIDVELAQCVGIVEKAGKSLGQIKADLAEIEQYMRKIAQERERLMGDSR